jgi:hypothetical protein
MIRDNGKKPSIFISHITEEKDLAVSLKELISVNFLEMIDVFVSSDKESISAGQNWLDALTNELSSCVLTVILCSPESVQRPWINFELGASWQRGIPIVPVCHSGMSKSDLPLPLALRQASDISNKEDLSKIFKQISGILESKEPEVNFDAFIDTATKFETSYTFWKHVNQAFQQLNEFNSAFIDALKENPKINISLSEVKMIQLKDILQILESNDILRLLKTGSSSLTPIGTLVGMQIRVLDHFDATVRDKEFIYYREFQ